MCIISRVCFHNKKAFACLSYGQVLNGQTDKDSRAISWLSSGNDGHVTGAAARVVARLIYQLL